jgi:hypothetical protein
MGLFSAMAERELIGKCWIRPGFHAENSVLHPSSPPLKIDARDALIPIL